LPNIPIIAIIIGKIKLKCKRRNWEFICNIFQKLFFFNLFLNFKYGLEKIKIEKKEVSSQNSDDDEMNYDSDEMMDFDVTENIEEKVTKNMDDSNVNLDENEGL